MKHIQNYSEFIRESFVQYDGYLYHATLNTNLPGIIEHGLKPKDHDNWQGVLGAGAELRDKIAKHSRGRVFFSIDPRQSLRYLRDVGGSIWYGREFDKDQRKNTVPKIALLRTSVDNETLRKSFVWDDEYSGDYYTTTTIIPNNLEIYNNGTWEPLVTSKSPLITSEEFPYTNVSHIDDFNQMYAKLLYNPNINTRRT